MQYLKHIFLGWFFLAASSHVIGQNIWHNTTVVGGFALAEQDRRLFDFPPAEGVLARNPKKLDYDLTLYVEKRVFRYKPFQLNAGIGYAENNTLFSRPFKHSSGQVLRYIKRYTINRLILPVSSKVFIGKFYLQINAMPGFSFRKNIIENGDDNRFTKWQFVLNNLEITPGIGLQLNQRLQLSLNYRYFYFHEVDKTVFYYILFDDPSPEFLQQKSETYNPFKMWLTVGYKLKK